jgi:hypothetical protein
MTLTNYPHLWPPTSIRPGPFIANLATIYPHAAYIPSLYPSPPEALLLPLCNAGLFPLKSGPPPCVQLKFDGDSNGHAATRTWRKGWKRRARWENMHDRAWGAVRVEQRRTNCQGRLPDRGAAVLSHCQG